MSRDLLLFGLYFRWRRRARALFVGALRGAWWRAFFRRRGTRGMAWAFGVAAAWAACVRRCARGDVCVLRALARSTPPSSVPATPACGSILLPAWLAPCIRRRWPCLRAALHTTYCRRINAHAPRQRAWLLIPHACLLFILLYLQYGSSSFIAFSSLYAYLSRRVPLTSHSMPIYRFLTCKPHCSSCRVSLPYCVDIFLCLLTYSAALITTIHTYYITTYAMWFCITFYAINAFYHNNNSTTTT